MKLNNNITRKNSESGLWRAINKSIPYLLKHGKWHICDGRSVDAWEDSWLEVGTCISDHVQSILASVQGAKVCYLVKEMGDWNWKMLQYWIP